MDSKDSSVISCVGKGRGSLAVCVGKRCRVFSTTLDTSVAAMNFLGSATVPKSLALQSQGWSFAATLRAGETEQQGLID